MTRALSIIAIFVAMLSCAKTESPTVQPAPEKAVPSTSASAASSIAKTVLAPAALPLCSKENPLSALCTLGKDASEAKFECKSPEPLLFCAKVDEWCCKYDATLADEIVPGADTGHSLPAIIYHARFDHKGPKVKDDEIIDVKKFKREGLIRGVAIFMKVADEAEGKSRLSEITRQLVSWGCTESEKGIRTIFKCGIWQASLRYDDIVKRVFLEAAHTGELECLP